MNAPARRDNWYLSNDASVAGFLKQANAARLSGKPLRIKILPDKRTLDQNALSFAIYKQIAAQSEDQSIVEIRMQCKLDYGIPILCEEEEEFANLWHKVEQSLTYEEQLELMKSQNVTSLLSKKGFTKYIDTIIRAYSAQGYSIVFPGEEY